MVTVTYKFHVDKYLQGKKIVPIERVPVFIGIKFVAFADVDILNKKATFTFDETKFDIENGKLIANCLFLFKEKKVKIIVLAQFNYEK
jgi:hypothetical protein